MDREELFRKHIIDAGRCMVRVRYRLSGELTTAAMCPGCWNSHTRRQVLLKKMELMDVEPVHKRDLLDGLYSNGKQHSDQCPYNAKLDPWDRFRLKRKGRMRWKK